MTDYDNYYNERTTYDNTVYDNNGNTSKPTKVDKLYNADKAEGSTKESSYQYDKNNSKTNGVNGNVNIKSNSANDKKEESSNLVINPEMPYYIGAKRENTSVEMMILSMSCVIMLAVAMISLNVYLTPTSCEDHNSKCHNGGTCYNNNGTASGIRCNCPQGYDGRYCQYKVYGKEQNRMCNFGICTRKNYETDCRSSKHVKKLHLLQCPSNKDSCWMSVYSFDNQLWTLHGCGRKDSRGICTVETKENTSHLVELENIPETFNDIKEDVISEKCCDYENCNGRQLSIEYTSGMTAMMWQNRQLHHLIHSIISISIAYYIA